MSRTHYIKNTLSCVAFQWRHLFLTVLETGKSKMKTLGDFFLRICFLRGSHLLTECSQGRQPGILWFSFLRPLSLQEGITMKESSLKAYPSEDYYIGVSTNIYL